MTPTVRWAQFHDYSGVSIGGSVPFELKPDSTHWDRIVWLTSIVESGGKFGAVISYDGTGATASLTQCIAVFPKELASEDGNPEDDQGALWSVIQKIKSSNPEITKELEEALSQKRWALKDSKIVNAQGATVNGRVLREELTPNQGRVPRQGEQWEQSKRWALILNRLFSDPRSFDIQVSFAIDHAKEVAKRKPPMLKESISKTIYCSNPDNILQFSLNDPLDLAMAVFFSNSVNAPAQAYKMFAQALEVFEKLNKHPVDVSNAQDRSLFAARLIRALGTTSFARWNAELPSGRYQRTRTTAMKLWPATFFNGPSAIMPKSF